jgi:hypothetical protein
VPRLQWIAGYNALVMPSDCQAVRRLEKAKQGNGRLYEHTLMKRLQPGMALSLENAHYILEAATIFAMLLKICIKLMIAPIPAMPPTELVPF